MTAGTSSPALPRIAIVDDDAGIRTMLRLTLEASGYAVELNDGTQALAAEPDLVLLDLRLGRTTGADWLAEGRLQPGTPIVLMTASHDHDAALRGRVPSSAVLGKPFDLDELLGLIETVLAGKSDGDTGVGSAEALAG
jgi:DNA-binding response OmpR family regulator